jgi:hypothetical protein
VQLQLLVRAIEVTEYGLEPFRGRLSVTLRRRFAQSHPVRGEDEGVRAVAKPHVEIEGLDSGSHCRANLANPAGRFPTFA